MLILLIALAFASCADKANPVVPPSGDPTSGGLQSGNGAYDAAVPGDVSSGLRDAAPDLNADLLLACPAPCDLLKQNCGGCPGNACYPVSGVARCQVVGTVGAQGPCVSPNDCAQGLTCIGITSTVSVCLAICDPLSPTACVLGSICQPLPAFNTAGYCQSG
jgi:hypothetical protein